MIGNAAGVASSLARCFFSRNAPEFLVSGLAPTVPATIRGSDITRNDDPLTLTLNLPDTSAAGDLAIIFAAGWNPTARAGWTDLGIDSRFTWTDIAATRILEAGDLFIPGSDDELSGTVTVDFHGGLDGVFALIVFVGPTGGVRSVQSLWTAGGVETWTNTFPATTMPGDTGVYFASVRGSPTAPVITPATGEATVLRQTINSGSTLATQVLPGGAMDVGNLFGSGAGAGGQACQITVIGSPGAGDDFILSDGNEIST